MDSDYTFFFCIWRTFRRWVTALLRPSFIHLFWTTISSANISTTFMSLFLYLPPNILFSAFPSFLLLFFFPFSSSFAPPHPLYMFLSTHFPLCRSSPHQSVSQPAVWQRCRVSWMQPDCQRISIHPTYSRTHLTCSKEQEKAIKMSGTQTKHLTHPNYRLLFEFPCIYLSKYVMRAGCKTRKIADSNTGLCLMPLFRV